MLHFWKIQNLRASPPCFSYSYYSENYIQLFVLKMYLPCFVLLIVTYITLNCCLFLKRLGLPSVMEDKNKCLLSFSVAAQCSISHMILTDVKVICTEIFFYLFDFLFAKHTIRRLFLSFCRVFLCNQHNKEVGFT